MFLGSHVSMKAPHYLLGAIQEAESYRANACMIYTGAPGNSRRIPVEQLKIEEGHRYMKDIGFDSKRVIVHAPYIINLANVVKPDIADFGQQFLAEELNRVAAIGADILVLHPGSALSGDRREAMESVAERLDAVLEKDRHSITIALETMAGKGSEIGYCFEELAAIKNRMTHSERIGFCLDTCHVHDAGYDVSRADDLLDQFDAVLGLENLAVIHLNDSKNEQGARKDRHANIGKGKIGFSALATIAHHPRLKEITKILETPYIEGKAPYRDEISRLKSWHRSEE
ncbi:MAG: deoxyribonuclease IV [Erysipelotrichaceae bacterium]|nr:deoxyribonuclease IV [Erysipelotrichaceae bacterium]